MYYDENYKQNDNMKEKLILGIETSCDDTSIALIQGNVEDFNQLPKILAFESFSQEILLRKWGGVVPEIAARNHMEKIPPLLESVMNHAQKKYAEIDLISVTTTPGLLGPLLTGLTTAKTLSLIHHTPIAPINHLMAHLEAIHLDSIVPYPYLGLLVSGGHSMFLKVEGPNQFEILGNTIDDAAGEAFDKGGKLLGLGYPAGKIIDDLAKTGDPKKISFPVSLLDKNEAHMSFSGLKSALRLFIEQGKNQSEKMEDICASYQHAIIEAFMKKLVVAKNIFTQKTKLSNFPIVVGGGVACNSYLRSQLSHMDQNILFVAPRFCTDNGAMVANLGLRSYASRIHFPECLNLDAKNLLVSKEQKLVDMKNKKAKGKTS